MRLLISLTTLLLVLGAPLASAQVESQTRPSSWARPIKLDGVPNLHQVAHNYYRSAQPSDEGFNALATQLKLRSIISLRAFHSDEPLTRGLNLRLTRFPIHTWHIEREDVVGSLRALRLAMATDPVLLHCQHGADRTGLISALYRVLYQDWSKREALDEMQKGEFGYHPIWGNIPSYISGVDVERLRHEIATQ
jgi:protein tyrosine/serine phosphatase